MGLRLQGKVAIVTGAGSGIGRACVSRFLEEGASIVATDIHPSALETLAREVAEAGGEIVTVAGDVTRREDVAAIVQAASAGFGRLDVLVNSAGITPRTVRAEADFEERWEAVMRVNVKGTLLMCHAAVEVMRATGGGSIVNLASVMGSVGYPTHLPF